MANIVVTATPSDVNVTTSISNITVTDSETNVSFNVSTTTNTVNVTTTQSNITVAQGVAVSNNEIRAAISNVFPILYDVTNGIISIDEDSINIANAILNGNITLKQFQETVYNHGNVTSGTLSVNISNGTIHTATLGANLSQISFSNLSAGGSATIILRQDPIGHRHLITTDSSWNNWLFVGENESLALDPNTYTAISVTYDGTKYFAAVGSFDTTIITNSQLANSNIIINGQTFELGSSGNITNFLANITMQQNLTVDGALTAESISSNTTVFANGIITSNTYVVTPQLYLGTPNTSNDKPITAYGAGGSESAAGQLVYDANDANETGKDGVWKFANDTSGTYYKLPTSTTDLLEGNNLYFTAARVRGNVSAVDAGGAGSFTYNSGTGAFTYTGASDAEIRSALSATSPITYNSGTGAIGLSGTANITTTGNISGGYILGNGAFLTGVATPYGNANVADFLANGFGSNTITTTGNIFTGNAEVRSLILNPLAANALITAENAGDDLYIQGDGVTIAIDRSTAGDDSFRVINDRDGSVLFQVGPDSGTLSPLCGTRVTGDLYVGTNDASNITGTFYVRASSGDINTKGGLETDGQIRTDSGGLAIYAPSGNIQTDQYFLGDGSLLSGIASNTGVVSYIATVPLTVGGNLTVNGNINATGNLNYQNVTDLYVTDQKITLNSNAATNSNVQIISNRPTATSTELKWNEQSTRWEFTNDGTTYYPIPTSTTDLAEGTNLYFTAARVRSNISVGENLTYSNSTGIIGMSNSLANINSISTETGQDLVLISEDPVRIRARQRNAVITDSANIAGAGYGLHVTTTFYNDPPFLTYSGSGELKTIVLDGTVTAGSNVITGVSNIQDLKGNPLTIGNIAANYVFMDEPLVSVSTFFPAGTYVVSASGSNIFMSANALYSDSLSVSGGLGSFSPGARDTVTGLLVAFESNYDGGGANAQQVDFNLMVDPKPRYGYPSTGPIATDFAYSIGTSSDYSANSTIVTKYMIGLTDFSASKTVGQFDRGLVVGNGDLTNRGENDGFATFGLNVVWDGTANSATEYGTTTGVFPQILLKSYTQGTNQAQSGALTTSGPRILFLSANGNASQDPLTTYARATQELGKIAWTSTTSASTTPSTTGPAAYISAVSLKDQTGGNPGDVGMYLVASPTNSGTNTSAVGGIGARALWAGHHQGNTLISAGARTNGTSGDIYFAPARQASNRGNAMQMADQVINTGSGSTQWARVGYDNPSANTGSRIFVTNGFNSSGTRSGNLSLGINRNDNSVGFGNKYWAFKLQPGSDNLVLTEDGTVRTTFTGGNISATAFYGDGGNLTNVTATANTFDNIVVAGQSNVVASGSSALTLVAGSGMTITTDASTDTITFTSTGGGGTYGDANVATFLAAYGSNTIVTTGNITAGNTIVNGVTFNASNIAPTSGQIRYNTDFGTHQVGLDGSNVMLMGQDLVVYARNDEATTLLKGEVVRISGASGDKATLKRATNDSDANSATTIGIVKSDIAVGQLGYVVSQGVVNGLNLGAYTSGDKLYLGNVAGTFTNIKPSAPEHYVFIGVVEKANAGNGQVLVRVQNGFELDEIHDIKLTSVQQNDMLIRNSGNTLWVNQSVSSVVANTNITLKQFSETRVALGNVTGDQSSNINLANGSIFTMTATGNITISSVTGATAGSSATLIITQDGSGNRLLTSTMKFAGASKTLSTAAGAIDIISLFYDGTTYYASLSKGYA